METGRRTQAQRRAESERRLLTASAELIVEHGLENTSLADIGRRAGASHAAVNHRFGSKDELVDRLIEEAGAYYIEVATERLAGRSGIDALLTVCALYLELVDSPDPLGRVHIVLWSEAIAHTAERRAAHLDWDRQFRRAVRAWLREAVADGSAAPDLPVAEVAMSVVATLRGLAMQLLLDPDGADLALAQQTMAAVLSDALRPQPASG